MLFNLNLMKGERVIKSLLFGNMMKYLDAQFMGVNFEWSKRYDEARSSIIFNMQRTSDNSYARADRIKCYNQEVEIERSKWPNDIAYRYSF